MSVLEINGLSSRQGSKYLLKDISWQVNEKEHWIVFGLNGCGKTTLLSILAGYRKYTEGNICLFGEKLTIENAISLRKNIGFVSNSFFDSCLKRENALNIVLGAKFGGLSEQYDVDDQDVLKAKHLLTSFGLSDRVSYPLDTLSKGQQQKVLLARSLMIEPKLLILDEPCASLDIFSRNYFLNTLCEIEAQTDATIIYVTHHSDEILPFFGKALLIKKGQVHSQGNIHEVFSTENISGFFGQTTEVEWVKDSVGFKINQKFHVANDLWRHNLDGKDD